MVAQLVVTVVERLVDMTVVMLVVSRVVQMV